MSKYIFPHSLYFWWQNYTVQISEFKITQLKCNYKITVTCDYTDQAYKNGVGGNQRSDLRHFFLPLRTWIFPELYQTQGYHQHITHQLQLQFYILMVLHWKDATIPDPK